jgi:HEAT repeat protein
MGLFDKYKNFKQEQHKKQVAKAIKLVKNAKAIREDRWAALTYLSELTDPEEAIPALLERFEYSLEHGINDTREKELAMEAIVGFKERAMPYLHDRLLKTPRIAWIIKMLKAIGSEEEVKEALKAALNFGDIAFDQSAVDKNFDILCYLRDYDLNDYVDKIQHFLNDPDERVRFAAVEVLLEQSETLIKPMVEGYLLDTSVENIRLHEIVKETYMQKKWPLISPGHFEEGRPYSDFYVKGGLVHRLHQ